MNNYILVAKIFLSTVLKMLIVGGVVLIPLLIINYKISNQ
jgi:hypothetical protein